MVQTLHIHQLPLLWSISMQFSFTFALSHWHLFLSYILPLHHIILSSHLCILEWLFSRAQGLTQDPDINSGPLIGGIKYNILTILISNCSFSRTESINTGGWEVSLKGWEERLQDMGCSNPTLCPMALSTSPHYLPRAESNILGKVKPHEPSINPLQINTQCKKQTFKNNKTKPGAAGQYVSLE